MILVTSYYTKGACLSSFIIGYCCYYACNWAWLFGYRSFNLSAYLKVFSVWSALELPGHTHASISIFTLSLARKESRSTIVNFELRNGTCYPYEAWPFWPSIARTHSLRPSKDLFISAPSICLSLSLSLQSAARSLPAKSTKSSLPHFLTPYSWILIWQIACERLDVSLIFVAWVVRTLFPYAISSIICSSDETNCSIRP